MPDKKGWGNTVLGWFVEFEDDKSGGAKPAAGKPPAAAPKPGADSSDAADDLIRRYAADGPGPAGKAADASPARSPSGEAPPDFVGGGAATAAAAGPVVSAAPGQPIDFDPVFKRAGLADTERDKVKRALELLSNLPAETPQAVKKQIVETSLKTFGVQIESIIETSVAEIQALHGAIQAGSADMAKLLDDSTKRISKLEQEIAAVKQIMDTRRAEQTSLETQARMYGLRVQQILEFFGQEKVSEVVKDSPRLVDPTGAKKAAPPAKK